MKSACRCPTTRALYSLTIPGSPTSEATGKNQGVSFDEMVTAQIGQVGTQMDGLAHVGVRVGRDDIFYNGFNRSEFARATGMEKLGVENVGPIFTRGVLLDVAGIRKQERLPVGYAITPQDLQACVDADHLEIRPGDVVLIHTGHGVLWMKDNDDLQLGRARHRHGRGEVAHRPESHADRRRHLGDRGRCRPKIPSGRFRSTSGTWCATASITWRTWIWPNWPRTRSMSSPSSSRRYD